MVVVVTAVAVEAVVELEMVGGLNPSVKPAVALAVTAAVVVVVVEPVFAAVLATDPRGLSMKDGAVPAAVDAAMLVDNAGAAPKVKPEVGAAAEVVMIGDANRDRPRVGADWVGADWVDAGGAGVDEGLIPKLNPPPWVGAAGAAAAGAGWVRVEGAGVPKLKPPPPAAMVVLAAEVTWTFGAPKLNPPKAMPPDAVVVVGATVAAGGAWEVAPKLKPPPAGAALFVCEDNIPPRVKPDPAAGAAEEPKVNPVAAVVWVVVARPNVPVAAAALGVPKEKPVPAEEFLAGAPKLKPPVGLALV